MKRNKKKKIWQRTAYFRNCNDHGPLSVIPIMYPIIYSWPECTHNTYHVYAEINDFCELCVAKYDKWRWENGLVYLIRARRQEKWVK